MSHNLHWGNPKQDDFDYILDAYSTTSINTNYTSSVPLAQYWKSTTKVLNNLREKIQLNGNENDLYFEYPTPSAGKAKSSMSDIMLITRQEKVAIEVKFTEVNEQYEVIKDWYKKVQTGKIVLAHWLDILKPFINNVESITKDSEIPYQFLHRTASACFNNNGRAICLYQIFVSDDTMVNFNSFIKKLKESIIKLSPKDNLDFYIQKIETIPQVEQKKPSEDEDFFAQIKSGEKLFKFGNEKIMKFDIKSNDFLEL